MSWADFFGGFILGVLLGGLMVGGVCSQRHMDKVFNERVKEHGCKIQETWVNGDKKTGDLCIEPNGTIIRR